MKGCEGKEKSRCLDELSVDEVMFVVNTQMEKILAYNNDIRSVG
jgi:hypothetical protein